MRDDEFVNTGEICTVFPGDDSKEEGFRCVDVGNFYKNAKGERVVVTDIEKAKKYSGLIDVPVYIRRAIDC